MHMTTGIARYMRRTRRPTSKEEWRMRRRREQRSAGRTNHASEEDHAAIMQFFRRNLGEPSRMLGLKNAVYVEVFGDTMGQRLMRLTNVEWRRGKPLRMQVIFARMSLDEIVKYITVELKHNAKNEAHVQDRQGHGHRGHQEDRQQREVQEDTVGTAEEGSGSGQDLWTATTQVDHEEAHFFAFVAYNIKENGQDRSRWNRLDPRTKNRKEPRRIGNPPLLFREYRSQHTGCWVCYGKGNNHAHDHRHCKVYEEDKKTYFAAHPDRKPKEGEEEDRIVQTVQAVGAKSRGDRGVQLTEYGMALQVYDRMIQTLGAEAPETDVFASRDAPLLRKCRRHWHQGDSAWHRHWGLKEWGPMYWHGSLDNTRRTVEKIVADRAKGILVITGIGSTPCLLESLRSTLNSITLNEMSFGPEEELFIDAKGVSMPSPGQAWGTKAFLVDGAQAQPTGDGALIRRVEAVPMKVMFDPRRGQISQLMALTSCPTPRSTTSSTTCGWGCTTVWQPRRGGPWSHLCISGITRCWSPASTRGMGSWRGSWITSRTNVMVRLGRSRRRGIFQE